MSRGCLSRHWGYGKHPERAPFGPDLRIRAPRPRWKPVGARQSPCWTEARSEGPCRGPGTAAFDARREPELFLLRPSERGRRGVTGAVMEPSAPSREVLETARRPPAGAPTPPVDAAARGAPSTARPPPWRRTAMGSSGVGRAPSRALGADRAPRLATRLAGPGGRRPDPVSPTPRGTATGGVTGGCRHGTRADVGGSFAPASPESRRRPRPVWRRGRGRALEGRRDHRRAPATEGRRAVAPEVAATAPASPRRPRRRDTPPDPTGRRVTGRPVGGRPFGGCWTFPRAERRRTMPSPSRSPRTARRRRRPSPARSVADARAVGPHDGARAVRRSPSAAVAEAAVRGVGRRPACARKRTESGAGPEWGGKGKKDRPKRT